MTEENEDQPLWCPDPKGCEPLAVYDCKNDAGFCGGALEKPWEHNGVENSLRLCRLQEISGIEQQPDLPNLGEVVELNRDEGMTRLTVVDMSPMEAQITNWVTSVMVLDSWMIPDEEEE